MDNSLEGKFGERTISRIYNFFIGQFFENHKNQLFTRRTAQKSRIVSKTQREFT